MVLRVFHGLMLSTYFFWWSFWSSHSPILKIGLSSYYCISRTLYIILWIRILLQIGILQVFASIYDVSFYFLDTILGRIEVDNFEKFKIIKYFFFYAFCITIKKTNVDLTQGHGIFFLFFKMIFNFFPS